MGGAYIQGEVLAKNLENFVLHGKAVVLMPNKFIIAATFNHNRLEKNLYFMLDLS
jgi:hypothetical protein